MRWCSWPKNFLDTAKTAMTQGMSERQMKPLDWLEYLANQRKGIEEDTERLLRDFAIGLQTAIQRDSPVIEVGRLLKKTDTAEVTELLAAYFAKLGLRLCVEENRAGTYSIQVLYTLNTDSTIAQLHALSQEPNVHDLTHIGLKLIGQRVAENIKRDLPVFSRWSVFSETSGFKVWSDKLKLTPEQINAVKIGFQKVLSE